MGTVVGTEDGMVDGIDVGVLLGLADKTHCPQDDVAEYTRVPVVAP